ncbi:MAG: hypothetical protein ACREEO_13640 [Phenylobacterium sp.]
MPIVAVFEFPGEDVAKYHSVFEVGGAPILEQPKRLSHTCYRTDRGFTVVDIWADEASFAAFGEIIGPATAQAGLEAKPLVYPLEGTIDADGTRHTY